MKWNEILIIAFAFVYIGLVFGIIIRFLEEKKYFIIPLAFVIPMMVFVMNLKYCVEIFGRKKKIINKFKYSIFALYIVTRYYNILIQFNAQVFIESKLNDNVKNIFSNEYDLEPRFEKVYGFNEDFMKRELKVG